MTFRLLAFARVYMILALLSTLALSRQVPASAQVGTGAAALAAPDPAGLIFVENVGQFPDAARFQVRGSDFTLWLAEDALWLMVFEPAANRPDGVLPLTREGVNIKLSFPGANPHPHLEPFDRLQTRLSYFTGSGPDQWRADVPVWGGVRYVDLYPGLDLVLTGQQGRMRPQLEAQPGADLSAVCLRVEGAETVTVEGGGLRLAAVAGQVTYTWPPLQAAGLTPGPSVQPAGASSFDVTTPFTATRDSALPATREPESRVQNPEMLADLLYGTFLGGSDIDGSSGIAVDRSGAAYVTGTTYSSDFPSTPGAFDTSHNGYGDAFVAKLNAAGSGLDYATFLGGGSEDGGSGIAVDRNGSAYITGSAGSAAFPPRRAPLTRPTTATPTFLWPS